MIIDEIIWLVATGIQVIVFFRAIGDRDSRRITSSAVWVFVCLTVDTINIFTILRH
jgi:hypothetical protein